MRKVFRLFTLIAILFTGTFSVYAQEDSTVTKESTTEEFTMESTTEESSEEEGYRQIAKQKFMEGGPLFMSILSFLFLSILVSFFFVKNKNIVILLGILTLIIGFFFTLIGMIGAFDSMEAAGDISPSLVAGGIKVSMITFVYSLLIFIVSVVLRIISLLIKKNNKAI